MAKPREFKELVAYLQKIPAMSEPIHWQRCDDGTWYVGFSLALEHPLAWSAVQELAHVLNTLSVAEHLPTRFLLRRHHLISTVLPAGTWAGASSRRYPASHQMKCLSGWRRLPQPVDDETKWIPSIVEECESPDDEE